MKCTPSIENCLKCQREDCTNDSVTDDEYANEVEIFHNPKKKRNNTEEKKEKNRQNFKKYYAKNREERCAKSRKWYHDNKAKERSKCAT